MEYDKAYINTVLNSLLNHMNVNIKILKPTQITNIYMTSLEKLCQTTSDKAGSKPGEKYPTISIPHIQSLGGYSKYKVKVFVVSNMSDDKPIGFAIVADTFNPKIEKDHTDEGDDHHDEIKECNILFEPENADFGDLKNVHISSLVAICTNPGIGKLLMMYIWNTLKQTRKETGMFFEVIDDSLGNFGTVGNVIEKTFKFYKTLGFKELKVIKQKYSRSRKTKHRKIGNEFWSGVYMYGRIPSEQYVLDTLNRVRIGHDKFTAPRSTGNIQTVATPPNSSSARSGRQSSGQSRSSGRRSSVQSRSSGRRSSVQSRSSSASGKSVPYELDYKHDETQEGSLNISKVPQLTNFAEDTYYLWGANITNYYNVFMESRNVYLNGRPLNGQGMASPTGPTLGKSNSHYVGVITTKTSSVTVQQIMTANDSVFSYLNQQKQSGSDIVIPGWYDQGTRRIRFSLGTGIALEGIDTTQKRIDWFDIMIHIVENLVLLDRSNTMYLFTFSADFEYMPFEHRDVTLSRLLGNLRESKRLFIAAVSTVPGAEAEEVNISPPNPEYDDIYREADNDDPASSEISELENESDEEQKGGGADGKKKTMYCGDQFNVPAGYDRYGTLYECFKRGIRNGYGMSKGDSDWDPAYDEPDALYGVADQRNWYYGQYAPAPQVVDPIDDA
jgi:hypothetical protein